MYFLWVDGITSKDIKSIGHQVVYTIEHGNSVNYDKWGLSICCRGIGGKSGVISEDSLAILFLKIGLYAVSQVYA